MGGLSVAGGKMKEIGNRNWKTTNSEVTNTAFFNGIPSGIRDYYNGTYGNSNLNCYWWSSTESKITDAWFLYLDNKSSLAYISSDDKPLGISVRCIKDQKY